MLDLTPALRLYARYRHQRLQRMAPMDSQLRLLRRLCRRAKDTRFGRDHDFSNIRTVGDYQRRVPLREYADFWSDYWEKQFPVLTDCTWPGTVPSFALTSGTTTGATKYIPYNREMGKHAVRGMLDLFVHHLIWRPESRAFGGKGLMLTGDLHLKEHAPGIHSGAVSAITARRTPRWLRSRILPSRELAEIEDWSEKIALLASAALGEDIRVLGGAPNWLLLLFDRLTGHQTDNPQRLTDLFPDLQLIVHGGVNFAPYRNRFQNLLKGSGAETREAYSASEGFFAVADRGDGEGLRLILDAGIFYEFVPVDELGASAPVRHWIATVEPGIEYALVVTTCAGAWAYLLGDTIRITDINPIRLVVTGRTSYVLSAFGEHLIEEEIARAVSDAAATIGADVSDYTVSPLFGGPDRPGDRHLYIVECTRNVDDETERETFASRLDSSLKRSNADYREQRAGDFGIRMPEVEFAPPGTFAAWMEKRGRIGGQNKVPRIIHDEALREDIRAFVASTPRTPVN